MMPSNRTSHNEDHFGSVAPSCSPTVQLSHHEVSKAYPATPPRSMYRRSKSQRCVGLGQGVPAPAPPCSGPRGLRPTGRPARGGIRSSRRDCARNLIRPASDFVTSNEKLLAPSEAEVDRFMGNDLVLGIVSDVLEESDDCEFEQEMSEEEEEEEDEGLFQGKLLLPQLENVLLSLRREQEEVEEVVDEPILSSMTSKGEEEMYSDEFVSSLIAFAIEDFADEVEPDVEPDVTFEDYSNEIGMVELPSTTVSCFAKRTLVDAVLNVVAEECNYEVCGLSDDDATSMDSFDDDHCKSEITAEGWEADEHELHDDIQSDGNVGQETWDDDSDLSVAMFGSECEFEVDHKVAESMAGHLVNGPSGLLESTVRMFDRNLEVLCALPAASSVGPCMRRRFSHHLRPSEIGPVAHQEVLPTDCLPVSRAVASGVPPCTEIDRYFSGLTQQPRQSWLPLSAEAVKVLFGSAHMSFCSLFQAAAVEACTMIQKHWRLHKQREVLNKLKVQQGILGLSGLASDMVASGNNDDLDLVALERAFCADLDGLELNEITSFEPSKETWLVNSAESIEACRMLPQPHPPTSTPTSRRRPQLMRKSSMAAPVKDDSNAVKPEVSEASVVPPTPKSEIIEGQIPPTPRRRPHLSGRKTVNTSVALSSPEILCVTVPDSKEAVPSPTLSPPPPPGPSPTSRRRPSVAKKTNVNFNGSNPVVRPVPQPLTSTSALWYAPHPEKKSIRHHPTPMMQLSPVKMDDNQVDQSTPTSTPRRHLSGNIAAAVARWPPSAESSIVTPRAGKQHPLAPSSVRHRTKDSTKMYRMDVEEDAVEAVRASSLVRSYQTLGVEMFNLDSDVERKARKVKPQKISKSGIAPHLESSWQVNAGTSAFDSPQATSVLASSGRAVLGAMRNRGVSVPANSGHTAMELDLGLSVTTKTRTDNARVSLDTPRKTPMKSSLLPALATPGKTAGNIAWSVKMAHSSTPRGGHQSVF